MAVNHGGVDWASRSVRQQWSWEAIYWSNTLAAGDGRLASKARAWPIQMPVKGSGKESTSYVRPLLELVAASLVFSGASGLVPAPDHDGGVANFRLGGGQREGSNCFSLSFRQVFSANSRGLCVITYLMGSFVIICTSTAWI